MVKDLSKLSHCLETHDCNCVRSSLRSYLLKYANKIIFKYHPLGFVSSILGSPSLNVNIRLHIWNQIGSIQDFELQIHNHKFELCSYVLLGSITNITYDIQKEKDALGRLYEIEYTDNASNMKQAKSNVKIHELDRRTIIEGEFYSVLPGQFHQSISNDHYTATIVRTENLRKEAPLVYSKGEYANPLPYERDVLDNEMNKRLITELFERLSK